VAQAQSSDAFRDSFVDCLTVVPEWNRLITELAETSAKGHSTILVTGPKGSGKSTFCRLLANRWITGLQQPDDARSNGVAFLDLDPGQPEFAPPGTMSLLHLALPNLSPPFCHAIINRNSRNRTVRSHALAAITPAQDSDHYLECALDLLAEYHRTLRGRCPLIINTPGWIQGSGLDLLCELIQRMRPASVIYLSEEGPAETVDGLSEACGATPLMTLPSQPSEYVARTPLHLRTMQTMSYFHQDPNTQGASQTQWDPRPLPDVAPWVVSYAGPGRGFFGIVFYDYSPPAHLVAEALNGTIVALVRIEDKAAFRMTVKACNAENVDTGSEQEDASDSQTGSSEKVDAASNRDLVVPSREHLPLVRMADGATLDPKHSSLVALALIRGIDVLNKSLHLLAPLDEQTLRAVADQPQSYVFVAGRFETPTWAYTEDLLSQSGNSASRDYEGQTQDPGSDTGLTDRLGPERETGNSQQSLETTGHPWVEVLRGDQKRAVGSRVWRVRRDLGRTASDAA
jgi:polynucleotide 5'-hydroxyl-kinase GRC3/NOL9